MSVSPDAGMGAAAAWVVQLVTGQVAVSAAILAVASLGIAAVTGRVRYRRALEVVAGIFVIFGAPVIGAGLASRQTSASSNVDMPPVASTPLSIVSPPVAVYDPYAGASVPQNQNTPGVPTQLR